MRLKYSSPIRVMPTHANKKIIKENFNWILISLHFGGGLHLAKVATIYFWLREPPRTENLQSNLHFWQIARGPTNFLFSTGLTKSTRQSGKECTKGRADRIWQKAVSTFAAIPAPSFSPTISLLAAAVGSSGWSGLNIIYQIFGHLAGHLGSTSMIYGILAYRSLRPKLDHGKFNKALRHTPRGCLTPVGSKMGARKNNK